MRRGVLADWLWQKSILDTDAVVSGGEQSSFSSASSHDQIRDNNVLAHCHDGLLAGERVEWSWSRSRNKVFHCFRAGERVMETERNNVAWMKLSTRLGMFSIPTYQQEGLSCS